MTIMDRLLPTYFRKPFGLSVGLHLFLFAFLMMHLPGFLGESTQPVKASLPQPKIVQATTVSQQQVQQQIQAIHQRAEQKRAAETARIAKLNAQAAAARKARVQEQQRVVKLKAQQILIHKQRVAAQKALVAKQQALKVVKQKALTFKQQQLQQKLMQQQLHSDETNLTKRDQQAKAQATAKKKMDQQINEYTNKIKGVIGSNWNVPTGASPDSQCVFSIHFAPDGSVLSLKLVKSSGNQALDQAARVAILKSAPLPVPKDPVEFDHFRVVNLALSPKNVRSIS